MERNAGYPNRLAIFELVGFVPDIRVGIDGGIGLDSVVKGKSARMVIMPMGDGDTVDSFKVNAEPFGIFKIDIAGTGVYEPAVSAG